MPRKVLLSRSNGHDQNATFTSEYYRNLIKLQSQLMKLRLAIWYSPSTSVPQGKCSGAKLKTFQGFSAGELFSRNKARECVPYCCKELRWRWASRVIDGWRPGAAFAGVSYRQCFPYAQPPGNPPQSRGAPQRRLRMLLLGELALVSTAEGNSCWLQSRLQRQWLAMQKLPTQGLYIKLSILTGRLG